ncbi:MAG: AAA family ATPase [Cyanobacteria bacterium P01_A01_bin.40]
MNQNLETRNLNYLNDSFITESSEPGLDLNEVKNTIFRKFPLVAGFTCVLTALALLKINTTPPNYTASFELLSEPVNIETKVTSKDDSSRETREQITSVELDEVQLKILKSPRLILRAVESLQNKYPGLNYQELTGDLTIEIISGNQEKQNILLVIYENSDQEKVSDVIDALTQTYLNYSVEKRQSGVKRGIAFLDRQIPKVSDEAKEIQDQIKLLRNQHNFVDPDKSLAQITARLDELDRKREQNESQLRELQLKSAQLERELQTQPEKSTMAISFATPRYLDLSNQLRAMDIEIGRKSAIFSPQSEILQALIQERQELNSLLVDAGADIREKINHKIAVVENRQTSIAADTDKLKVRLEQWSAISGEFNNLKQKLNIANNKLNGFTSQKDELQIDAAQQESPWQLLTPAREPKLNNVSTFNYLVLSSTLGLILGSGVALLLDKHQKIIYTSAKVEEITRLPILITIPYSPKAKQLSLLSNISWSRQERRLSPQNQNHELSSNIEVLPVKHSNPSMEAFRSFAANLGLLNFNTDSATDFAAHLKSVVITSAIPREGKSTVALNLARASASMGKQVLLVDTDLRSVDRLTTDLGFDSQIGLKDILSPHNRYQALNCVKQLPPEENLFILTSGLGTGVYDLAAQDHSRLLASEKMHDLMGELEDHFDLVIYDLCSIIGFADVNLIAAQTDGIVVVTGLGKIQSVALTEALNQLRLCNAPVLGIAVNKVVNKN